MADRHGRNTHSALGLESGASQDEVKEAFHKAAFWCHPDKNPGNRVAEATFKRVSAAYQLLRKGDAPSARGHARTQDPGAGDQSEKRKAAQRDAVAREAARRAAEERAAAERAATAERSAARRAEAAARAVAEEARLAAAHRAAAAEKAAAALQASTGVIPWCRTCQWHRRARKYEEYMNGAWSQPTMPAPEILPCSRTDVQDTWTAYYALPRGRRALFPKACPKWTQRPPHWVVAAVRGWLKGPPLRK
jgi:hypothetical protein